MVNKYEIPNEIEKAIDSGEKEGLFRIKETKIEYISQRKSYRITDPEEHVRAMFYLELIRKYQYPKKRIDFEVSVKGEKRPAADIVVYEDDEGKKPYIVVECKKDGISQAEIKQAIEEGIPNAHYLKSKYAIVVAGNVRIAFDIANFPPQEREKNVIADIPVRYGRVVKYVYKKGGPVDKDDPSKELKEVTRDELLAKFQQCHDTLWEGGKRNPAEAFDEMSKLMYCKIQDERFLTQKGGYYRFQVGTYETINEVAERIRKIYKDAQEIDPEVFVEPIKTDDPIIYTVAEILQGISLARTDLDVKGEGYEHFLGGVFRGAMGQYFTPRPIVAFMVNFLEPNINDFVIDPACGSGGFLIYTLEKMRKELHAKLDEKDAAYRWQDFALKQVYGIEINSQLARVSMMNMIIHEDGHTNIENADSLDNPEIWKRQKIREYFGRKFTVLLTNPPFGADVKEREKPYLMNYELGGKIRRRNRQSTEVLFIERCLDFLKPGGRMGIVLPDGILTNSSLQYVRDFITEKAQILGVVSLPQAAFRRPSSKGSGDTGSGVKASLLFLQKKKESAKLPKDYPIFMSIAEHIGYDSTGRPDKDEFPDILKAWQEFRSTNKIDFFVSAPLCFAIGRGEIDDAFNPRRFASRTTPVEKWLRIKDIGTTIFEPYNPQKYAYEEEFDWFRIDDLENDPVGVISPRRVKGKEIRGLVQLLQENDILVARLGPSISNKKFVTVPHTTKQPIGSTEFIVLRPNNDLDHYFILGVFKTDFYTNLMLSKGRGGTPSRYRLNRTDFSLLPFPNIGVEAQHGIGMEIEQAFKIKREKESEAEEILNSIDDYVLDELGIKLPLLEEERNFTVTFDKVRGKRFDPYSHQLKFEKAYSALSAGKYELRHIGEFILDISGGATPKAKGDSYTGPEGIPFLRIQNVTPDGVSFEGMNYISEQTHEGLLKRSWLKSGDVVFTITGRIGTVAVISKDWEKGNINQHMVRLRFKEEVLPDYFAAFFNTDFGNQQALRLTSGGSRIALDYKAIRSLKISLPPLSIQQKIAQQVKSRREKAKELKQEARETLAEAKEKLEKMILGEND